MSITFVGDSKPANPQVGSMYFDVFDQAHRVWDGREWKICVWTDKAYDNSPVPSEEELNDHPSLKQSWEEYLVIRRLLGL